MVRFISPWIQRRSAASAMAAAKARFEDIAETDVYLKQDRIFLSYKSNTAVYQEFEKVYKTCQSAMDSYGEENWTQFGFDHFVNTIGASLLTEQPMKIFATIDDAKCAESSDYKRYWESLNQPSDQIFQDLLDSLTAVRAKAWNDPNLDNLETNLIAINTWFQTNGDALWTAVLASLKTWEGSFNQTSYPGYLMKMDLRFGRRRRDLLSNGLAPENKTCSDKKVDALIDRESKLIRKLGCIMNDRTKVWTHCPELPIAYPAQQTFEEVIPDYKMVHFAPDPSLLCN